MLGTYNDFLALANAEAKRANDAGLKLHTILVSPNVAASLADEGHVLDPNTVTNVSTDHGFVVVRENECLRNDMIEFESTKMINFATF